MIEIVGRFTLPFSFSDTGLNCGAEFQIHTDSKAATWISREEERDKIVFYRQVYASQKENYLEKDERNKNYVGLMFTANNYQLPAYVSCVT